MNYYQSLNKNNKIFFVKYQICKLQNKLDYFDYLIDDYINDEPQYDNDTMDSEYYYNCEQRIKLSKLLDQKKLKLTLIKKYYE
jgi:hypothetical protein